MRCLLLLTVTLICGSTLLLSQPLHPLGVNVSDNGAFVNIVNHTNRYVKASGFDSLGWATSDFEMVLMDGRPVAEWANDIDDPEVYRIDYSGTYKSSFRGKADISISGSGASIRNKAYNDATNITSFEIVLPSPPQKDHGFLYMSFRNTQRTSASPTNSGITELRVLRPGYELSTSKIFTDEYLRLLQAADFVCYRYYAIQNIWGCEPVYPQRTTWQQRKTPRDACQDEMTQLNNKKDGWCWEYIIELANRLKKDIWICIPLSADSDYVAQLSLKLKNELEPSINIYIESSNEVWSPTQETHGPYCKALADANKISFDESYARRTVEVANWVAAIFGNDAMHKKVRIVLGAQQSYGGRSDNHLNYIRKTFGAPKNFIYATAPALYFGSTNANADTTAINQGMITDITNQIANRTAHINRAKQWELLGGCISYEGGPGLPSGGAKTNLANQIMANRSYAMKDIVKRNFIDAWFSLGGGPAMFFILSSGYNRYGCWGITDDYTKPDRNYKMQAVREILGSNTTSVEGEPKENTLTARVQPNPVSDEVQLLFPQAMPARGSLHIYNIMGQCVVSLSLHQCQTSANTLRFSLRGQAAGLYRYQLDSDGKRYSGNFVVQP